MHYGRGARRTPSHVATGLNRRPGVRLSNEQHRMESDAWLKTENPLRGLARYHS
jgi:hypothetical protein